MFAALVLGARAQMPAGQVELAAVVDFVGSVEVALALVFPAEEAVHVAGPGEYQLLGFPTETAQEAQLGIPEDESKKSAELAGIVLAGRQSSTGIWMEDDIRAASATAWIGEHSTAAPVPALVLVLEKLESILRLVPALQPRLPLSSSFSLLERPVS